MRIDYRQGLIRFQTDVAGNPAFLQPVGGGAQIALIVVEDPTLVACAHGLFSDYLHEEGETVNPAWIGPFSTGTDYWLYWDIDLATGIRTFGHTTIEPVAATAAPPAVQDQHWFDLKEQTMKVRKGPRWVDVVRVFAAKYDNGSVLIPYGLKSQVGLNTPTKAGYILFDEDDEPVKKFERFNRGVFRTTESALSAQTARQSNFRLEAAIVEAPAAEHIPAYHAVAYIEPGKLGLARQNVPKFPAVGVAQDDFFVTKRRSFISRGHIRDKNFNWTQPPNTPLFVGLTGNLTHIIPQSISLQQVAIVVSPKVIYVDVKPIICYS